ncbi:MAG: PepSY-associated TM helix domain-containing protein [Polyangiales bacterium]
MPTPGKRSEPLAGEPTPATTTPAATADPPRRRAAWRPWLRAIHRDLGYVAVGLTVIYAGSGLAVNHIADWDPSFHDDSTVSELGPLAGDDAAIARVVLDRLRVEPRPRDVYRSAPDRLDLVFADKRTIHVNPITGHVVDEGQRPRFLLRIANWLHLNRGKKAWTLFADAYAAGLLFLAASGMFMIAGKKGFFWRGAALVALGVAIPTVYVVVSGGP